MKRVGVIGASGYSGGELLRILAGHGGVEIAHAISRSHSGRKVHELHPNLRGVLGIEFEDLPPEEVAGDCDLLFTAVPHGAAMDIAPRALDAGAMVVDLSGDFRFKDTSVYERYYGIDHSCPEVKAVYGLPELHREEIKKARFVANPGCYPTATILGLAPLIKEGIIENERIVADAKSGVSGAGASPSATTHFCMANESVLAYSPAAHRHLPEIEQELSSLGGSVKVSFVPHLVPVNRGISVTLHCFLRKGQSEEGVRRLYERFYEKEPFIRVLDVGEVPRLSAVRGSNFNDIGCFRVDMERGRLIVVSASDNLVKGAAGQAVQNMNLMLGFEETRGLRSIALHP
ncbi:MAG: N-acetyl-gamma-glutamyl-phosphate reductase [Methanobacteriota archaeon]|nr:MAG: N-acetyl-gamma-glutamyl-phosphate reductase [Euryarchaeota archaeon]